MAQLTNHDVIAAWSSASPEVVAGFGEEGDVTRRYLLNPAIFALVGTVTGKRVLDAGCGQGYLARLLANKGAVVTGVEPSDPWYTYAVEREHAEPLGIRYVQADLSTWVTRPHAFDCVIANMVLMDIPDYLPALRTCIRALKRQGSLIVSLLHPCFEEPGSAWQAKSCVEVREYFQERAIQQTYGHFIHRPFSTYLNSIIQEGCILQKVLEPQLDEAVARRYHAQRYWHVPGYVVIHAAKT